MLKCRLLVFYMGLFLLPTPHAFGQPSQYDGTISAGPDLPDIQVRLSFWSSLILTSHEDPFPTDPLERLRLRSSAVVSFILQGNSEIERFSAFYSEAKWNRQNGSLLLSPDTNGNGSAVVRPTIRLQRLAGGEFSGTVESIAAPAIPIAIHLRAAGQADIPNDNRMAGVAGLYHGSCPVTFAPGERLLARYFRIVPIRRNLTSNETPKDAAIRSLSYRGHALCVSGSQLIVCTKYESGAFNFFTGQLQLFQNGVPTTCQYREPGRLDCSSANLPRCALQRIGGFEKN